MSVLYLDKSMWTSIAGRFNKLTMPLTRQGNTAYCVPYSICNIAQYYRINVTPKEVVKIMKAHKTQGTADKDILNGMKQLGLSFKPIKYTARDIRISILNCTPVVISYLADNNEVHFSTISGIKVKNNINYYRLNDTYYGIIYLPEHLLRILMVEAAKAEGKRNIWIKKVVRR